MNALTNSDNSGAAIFYQKVMPLYTKAILSRAMYVISRLCVAELLEKGPMHAKDLTEKLHCDADNLQRVLNFLAYKGIFKKDGEGRFENTSRSLLLRRSEMIDKFMHDGTVAGKEMKKSIAEEMGLFDDNGEPDPGQLTPNLVFKWMST